MKKILSFFITISVTFALAGCVNRVSDNLEIRYSMDTAAYVYYGRVAILDCSVRDNDRLENSSDSSEILSGEFEKFMFSDNKVIILSDDIYYEYSLQTNEVNEYTDTEFEDYYGKENDLDWYTGRTNYTPEEVPEKNLIIRRESEAVCYSYSRKALVLMEYSDSANDSLKVKVKDYDGGIFNYEILSGKFEKVAYDKDMLFILTDNKYYAFDVGDYQIPQLPEGIWAPDEDDYQLTEYTGDEFKKLYPEYEEFEWYGH